VTARRPVLASETERSHQPISRLADLMGTCVALGADQVPGLSDQEKHLVEAAPGPRWDVNAVKEQILAGEDPLGVAFCQIRTADERRAQGQTFTPAALVQAMVAWSQVQVDPGRIVDPGVGSGRYLLAAGHAHPKATLFGADTDPVATLMARANLAATGMADRAQVELADYRQLVLPAIKDSTLFIGNPPYVRHHDIPRGWKRWLSETAAEHGYRASQLAGLHVHFFLATLAHARDGDLGVLVTSAEWLDVNYGSLVRDLLTGPLGGQSIHVIDPTATPFADAATTAAITCFEVGRSVESIRLQAADGPADLGALTAGRAVDRDTLRGASRWTPLLRGVSKAPSGYIELGELARVHRGTVTGANRVWVTSRDQTALPEPVLTPAITKARELFEAGEVLKEASGLRVVIDLPQDLDELNGQDRVKVEQFLARPDVRQARHGYVASSRKAWWSVCMGAPAPILATYMARRPPAFVLNLAHARHINIAHGIYPRQAITDRATANLAAHLRASVTLGQGRVYAGGLTKFEPREMERLMVPALEVLDDADYAPGLG